MKSITNYHIILFDGVCNFCNASVRLIIKNDPKKQFRFSPLQSDFSHQLLNGRIQDDQVLRSLILIEKGEVFTKSTAAIKIARKMSGLWPLFYMLIIIPDPLRNFFYDLVGSNRYRIFGKRENCMVPDEKIKSRFL